MAPYRYLEEYNIEITQEVRGFYQRILTEIGEDVQREGLQKTPERMIRAC